MHSVDLTLTREYAKHVTIGGWLPRGMGFWPLRLLWLVPQRLHMETGVDKFQNSLADHWVVCSIYCYSLSLSLLRVKVSLGVKEGNYFHADSKGGNFDDVLHYGVCLDNLLKFLPQGANIPCNTCMLRGHRTKNMPSPLTVHDVS